MAKCILVTYADMQHIVCLIYTSLGKIFGDVSNKLKTWQHLFNTHVL